MQDDPSCPLGPPQPGWGPRVGKWARSLLESCCVCGTLALPFYPTIHWAGPQAKGLRVVVGEGGPFLCRWGADSPLPQLKAHQGSKHELMWPECHLFYWRKICAKERQPRWKASSCPTHSPLPVPLEPLQSSLPALLVTLPLTLQPEMWMCFLPLGQDPLPF